jgi:hypothetical protein
MRGPGGAVRTSRAALGVSAIAAGVPATVMMQIKQADARIMALPPGSSEMDIPALAAL